MWSFHWMGERKFDQTVWITWPRWPPHHGKSSKGHLLWNQNVDDLESWYAALGTQVLPSLFKWWPWDDLDLFHGNVKFGPFFCMEKKVKQWIFSETIVVYDIKIGRCSQLNEYMNLYEYHRSRSFIDLGPNHSDSIVLNFFSSITADFNISSALRWAIQDQWSSVLIFFPANSVFRLPWQPIKVCSLEKNWYGW